MKSAVIYSFACKKCCAGWTTYDEDGNTCRFCGQPGALRGTYMSFTLEDPPR